MFDQVTKIVYRGREYDHFHGSPFDRGSADSYYGRPRWPHKGGSGGPLGFDPITALSEEELEAYHAGYDYNEEFGGKKDF